MAEEEKRIQSGRKKEPKIKRTEILRAVVGETLEEETWWREAFKNHVNQCDALSGSPESRSGQETEKKKEEERRKKDYEMGKN
ncbi:hypothetical protein E3N88_40381 [Mikania micrantha]|uniref:Uncharacterized protein n=1 Tax=Mikania micrantha TaxID=192012 RepID=A0A5N6LML1_9ASTR|nr:hypothetical protein E3N88_40381 [Mikania micrantha]